MEANYRLIIYSPPEVAEILDVHALVSAGYDVTTEINPQAVESLLISNPHNSLIIITQSSATEGLAYSAEILQKHPSIPIILITSEINQSFLRLAFDIGLANYLITPIDSPTLIRAIERALIRQKSDEVEDRYYQVLNEISDGFVLVDLDYRIILVNQSARLIFQVDGQRIEGKAVDEVFHHPDFLDIFKPERKYPYRIEISLEDGRVISAQSSLIPNIAIAVTMQEITHLKDLDRVKTDLVNTVSHDLRSPLTAIYGFIGLIDRVGPINQQQAEFIRHIQSSVQHITSLINDLLDLSRMEAGYDLQMVDVDMKNVLQQTISNLEYQISEKMQDVVLSVPEGLPIILGNPLHLQRMASNLIENAIKFSPPLGRIDVRCRAETSQLILEIADNGPAIPLSDQPHVFEKFYRGSNLSKGTSGTGLGLSIVKSIVEKHHGRIWLESSDKGTTFTIIFPIK